MEQRRVKLAAAALACAMALTLAACGAAPDDAGSGAPESDSRSSRAAVKGEAAQDLENARRAAEDFGEDAEHSVKDGEADMKNALDNALENGRMKEDTRAALHQQNSKANTGAGAGAIYGNGATGSTQNTTNPGVSMTGVR